MFFLLDTMADTIPMATRHTIQVRRDLIRHARYFAGGAKLETASEKAMTWLHHVNPA